MSVSPIGLLSSLVLLAYPLAAIAQTDLPEVQGSLHHRVDYVIDFNENTKLANWLSYTLQADMLSNEVANCRSVREDDIDNAFSSHDLNSLSPLFEKGHLKPVAHSAYNQDACAAAGMVSNLIPQTPRLNNGLWRLLENHSARMATNLGKIQVITGPIPIWMDTLASGVPIPIGCWKILIGPETPGSFPIECYALPQSPYFDELEQYKISVNSLSALLGYVPVSTLHAAKKWDWVSPYDAREMLDFEMPGFEKWLQSCKQEEGGTLHGLAGIGAYSQLLVKVEDCLKSINNDRNDLLDALRFGFVASKELGQSKKARAFEEEYWAHVESMISESQCPSTIDYQGHTYSTALVRGTCWFTENLQSTQFNNGDAIASHRVEVARYPENAASCVYGFDEKIPRTNERVESAVIVGEEHLKAHGLLYNHHVVMDERNVCPIGWRIAMDEDWIGLGNYGGSADVSLSAGTLSWSEWEHDGLSDLSLLGLGFGGSFQDYDEPTFTGLGKEGVWWISSSKQRSPLLSHFDRNSRELTLNPTLHPTSPRGYLFGAYSIRCVKETFGVTQNFEIEALMNWEAHALYSWNTLQSTFMDRLSKGE